MKNLHFAAGQLECEMAALMADYPDLKEDEVLRGDMFEGSTNLHDVLSRAVTQAQDAKAMAAAAKARADELKARAAKFERQQEAMRALCQRLMTAADLKKVVLPEATLSRAASPPSVIITDPDAIPQEFQRVKVEADKTAIKAALKAGTSVPGATLSNGGENLIVRVA